MRHEKAKESMFLLSVIAAVFPLAAVVLSLFAHTEPYQFFTIAVYLMEGSLIGSIFGVTALIGNRRVKNGKGIVLSLIPMILLVLTVVGDAIFSCNMP